jgi:peptidoglycan hydrolase CwlO-like protein
MDSKDFSSLSDNPKMTEEAELPVGEVQKENSQELPKEEVPIEPKSGGSIFGDFIEKDDNKTSIHGINQPKAKKDISSKIQQKQGDLSSLKSRLTGLQSEERVKLESEIKDLESEISHLHNQSTDE